MIGSNSGLYSRLSQSGAANLALGDTYDVLLTSFGDGFPVGQITFTFTDTPRKISGIQKVAQVFTKILMTSIGSDLLRPNHGTMFKEVVMSSNVSEETPALYDLIDSAIMAAAEQTKNTLNTIDTPPEGRLQYASNNGLFRQTEGISVVMRIVTEAGEQGILSVPFPELDLRKAK